MTIRPPIAHTVKLEFNWAFTAGAFAHNIGYCLLPTTANPADGPTLQAIANSVMTAYAVTGGGPITYHGAGIKLSGVTVSDNSGASTAFANSTHPAVFGSAVGTYAPQVAICLSWQIASRYRGGHPRWYLPGMDSSAAPSGSAAIGGGFAVNLQIAALQFLNGVNTTTVPGGGTIELGTCRFSSKSAPGFVPSFYPFLGVEVHERLDSQRRRSGKESAFPHYP